MGMELKTEELIVKCKVDMFSDLCAQLSDDGLGELLVIVENEIKRRHTNENR